MTRAPFDPRFTLQAMDEIIPGLWQGMRPETYVGFDLVVSCEQHLARKPMDGYAGLTLHLPMRDEDDFPLDSVRIGHAATLIDSVLRQGGRVLVHCTGGLNRSSVVTARAVMLAAGCSPREAVELIRARRNEFCLCNRAFERFVLGETLPTAETSAFRDT